MSVINNTAVITTSLDGPIRPEVILGSWAYSNVLDPQGEYRLDESPDGFFDGEVSGTAIEYANEVDQDGVLISSPLSHSVDDPLQAFHLKYVGSATRSVLSIDCPSGTVLPLMGSAQWVLVYPSHVGSESTCSGGAMFSLATDDGSSVTFGQPWQGPAPMTVPVLSPPPTPLGSFEDNLEDPFLVQTGEPHLEPKVDIVEIRTDLAPGGELLVEVITDLPKEEDFSFAAVLYLYAGGETFAYHWEIHENSEQIGQIDPKTFSPVTPPSGAIISLGEESADGQLNGVATFVIPLIDFSGHMLGGISAQTFHMLTPAGPWSMDEAGPFPFLLPSSGS